MAKQSLCLDSLSAAGAEQVKQAACSAIRGGGPFRDALSLAGKVQSEQDACVQRMLRALVCE